jgi:RNA polymerase sigma factor (sigma-70 family)
MSASRGVDDMELLEAWRHGDRAAGSELFERHYSAVARFFHNKVNEATQEDLIHETFVACMKSVERFRKQSSFKTFLFGIAKKVLADHLRKVSRRRVWLVSQADVDADADADVDAAPAVSYGLSPVALAVQKQEQRLLLEALRRIPLNYQIALELHYWEDLTASEIGEVLGVPVGTAKTRLRDGKAYLEEQLRKIASSSEVLRSTLDDLEKWARRVRAWIGPPPPGAAARAR